MNFFHFCNRVSAFTISSKGRSKTRWELLLDSLCKTYRPQFLTKWSIVTFKLTWESTNWAQDRDVLPLVVAVAPVVVTAMQWALMVAIPRFNSKTSQGTRAKMEEDHMVPLTHSWPRVPLDKPWRTWTLVSGRRCLYSRCWLWEAMKTTKTTTDSVTVSLVVKWRLPISKSISLS